MYYFVAAVILASFVIVSILVSPKITFNGTVNSINTNSYSSPNIRNMQYKSYAV